MDTFAGDEQMKIIKQKQNTVDKVKKNYKRPELTIFGTINQITENTSMGPVSDAGKGQNSMQS